MKSEINVDLVDKIVRVLTGSLIPTAVFAKLLGIRESAQLHSVILTMGGRRPQGCSQTVIEARDFYYVLTRLKPVETITYLGDLK